MALVESMTVEPMETSHNKDSSSSQDNPGEAQDILTSSEQQGMESTGLLSKVKTDEPQGIASYESTHKKCKSKGCVISFDKVTYEVKDTGGPRRGCCGKKRMKFVLKDVSGVFRPGVNAILGPTGSGKTSLLDVIAGRKAEKGLSGEVRVDGIIAPQNLRFISGYVMQDDTVSDMLTVRENILFSASLRLPTGMSQADRLQRVNDLLTDLGLTKCADTRVGTIFVRGVSGGERKRTNIAMELVTSPSVLFLDEPTSGLDANTAHSVILLLHRLARRGMTIVLSIHQPRYSIYRLFDRLMLLSEGETIYHGPTGDCMQHFEKLGYLCEAHNSPPDFFLDVISGSIQPTNQKRPDSHVTARLSMNGSTKEKNGLESLLLDIPELDSPPDLQQSLVNAYQSSRWHEELKEELRRIVEGSEKSDEHSDTLVHKKSSVIRYETSFCKQFAVIGARNWKSILRNRHALLTQLFSAILLGLIVGSIYFRTGYLGAREGIQNRVGAFFFIVMNYVYGNMAAVDIFIKERAIFIHETVSGYYRVSSYFLSKLICDVIPQRFLPITFFALISYYLIGFTLSFEHFLFFLLNILLTSLAATAVALLFSATTRQHGIATVLTAMVWTCMMIYSGMLVLVDTVPAWLRWIKWLSIFRYSMNAFEVNELKDLFVCDPLGTSSDNSTAHHLLPKYNCSGNVYLEDQGIAFTRPLDLWVNECALAALTCAFLVLTYVQLRTTKSFH